MYIVVAALATSSSALRPSAGKLATPADAVSAMGRSVGLHGQLLHRAEHAGEHGVRLLVGRLGQHEQELVGAVPAHQVAAAQLRGERRGPVAQDLVAGLPARRLVDVARSRRGRA